MSKRSSCRIVAGFLVEAALWASLIGIFLSAYLDYQRGAGDAVVPHLIVVGHALLLLVGLRLTIWRVIRHERVAQWVAAAILLAFLITLSGYYLIVLAGLGSWGRVISWLLIRSYAFQLPEFIEALGVHFPAALIASILTALGAWTLISVFQAKNDWTRKLASRSSAPVAWAIAAGCAVVGGVGLFEFAAVPAVQAREPLSLTFFADQLERGMQSHGAPGREARDPVAIATRKNYVPRTVSHRRNVIVIVGDALRADRLGVYGYARNTTPYLTELQSLGQAEIVENMMSVCAESACGLLALARSRFVHQMTNHDISLYEVLQWHGYRIEMILGGDHTNFYSLKEAYGPVDSYFDGASAHGYYMNDDRFVLKRADELPLWSGQPTLFQFHLMSSHALGRRWGSPSEFSPVKNYTPWVTQKGPVTRADEEVRAAGNYYDNGVRQFDGVVRALLATLERKGYLQDALIAVTGDHGEMLGEHGEFGHAKSLYQPALHIPLVLIRRGYARQGQAPGRDLTSQIDIAPTILHELGLAAPPSWVGLALHSLANRRHMFFQQGASVGVADLSESQRPVKYWRELESGDEFVYSLSEDPREERNLIRLFQGSDRLSEWRLSTLPAVSSSRVQRREMR